VEAAQAAQRAGDASEAEEANKRLIALAFRELAQLRLLEGATTQGIDLYTRALEFEDTADTHVDVAIADWRANRIDAALGQVSTALAAEPQNARAYAVQARLWIAKQKYENAAEAFNHLLQIDPSVESDLETMYSFGVCYLQEKDPRGPGMAAAVFQRIERVHGDSGSLHVLFGRAYRDAEDMPSAIREFERAIALDTRTPHAHYFLGLAHLAANEWKPTPEVRAEFAKELEYFPRDYLANYMMGFTAASERDYAVSDRYLKIAQQLDTNSPEPPLYLGLNAYAEGDYKTAEAMFRKAIALTGSDEERNNFQIRRAYVDLGRILANSGRETESETFLTKARELQEKTMALTQQSVSAMAIAGGAGSAAAIMPLARKDETAAAPLPGANVDLFAPVDAATLAQSNLTEQQRRAGSAQETRLREVLGLAFNDLATSQAVRKEYAKALANYEEAEKWDATVSGLSRNLGVCAFRAENYPEAIRGLGAALKKNAADAPIRGMLGMAYYASDQFGEAVKAFTPLGMRGEQDPAVGYAWAASLARNGELKPAGEVLSQAEKAQLPAETLLLVGQLWLEIGDYTRATEALHRALQMNASLPRAHYFAGQAYLREEKWGESENEFRAELELAPEDLDAKFHLGFVEAHESRVDEAEALFRQVLQLNPQYANAQYELGKILLDRGELQEAVTHLEAATRLSPQTDYMHYQLQAAYRKESRDADANRELEIYKELKAKQRAHDRESIPRVQSP
jgi:tetratricopeptide (TPR) repeat protein